MVRTRRVKDVTLDPKTVQKVATGEIPAKRRARKKATHKPVKPAETVELHPSIAAYIKKHKVPASKIEVVSPTNIIIRN